MKFPSFFFIFLWEIFTLMDPDPLTWLNPIPIRNTAKILLGRDPALDFCIFCTFVSCTMYCTIYKTTCTPHKTLSSPKHCWHADLYRVRCGSWRPAMPAGDQPSHLGAGQLCKAYIRTNTYRQTPKFRHPFLKKQGFSLKYVLVTPSKNFWRYVWIRNICDNEVQFTILTVQALKKLLSAGLQVTSTLPNSDTQKDLLM